MITEQPFLPLFFNPEDGEIWEQLQKLPPEKRTETVKQALHEFFQTHSEFQAENMISSELVSSGNTSASPNSPLTINNVDLDVTENELSLESLFEASPQAIKPDSLKNLFSVIGEEDDEEVVKLLLSDKKPDTELKMETELKEPEQHIEKNEVPLREETMAASGGLAYLLHNVIGEEEDEEVLHFFQNIVKKKEK